jgi:ketosteroid isomerase-like protein
MSEANKETVRRFFIALGSGDVATLKTLVTNDVEAITPGTAKISGTRNYDVILQLCEAFPKITKGGVEFRFLNLTAEDDRVACEMEGRSTLVNGTPYNNCYHFLVFFRDGKICRLKEYLDTKLGDEALGPFIT